MKLKRVNRILHQLKTILREMMENNGGSEASAASVSTERLYDELLRCPYVDDPYERVQKIFHRKYVARLTVAPTRASFLQLVRCANVRRASAKSECHLSANIGGEVNCERAP